MGHKSLGVAVISAVLSMPAWPAGLPEIYNLARERAPEMRAVDAAFEATDAVRTHSLRSLLPTITASGESAKNKQDVVKTGVGNTGEFDFDSNSYTLTLRQPLFRQDLFARVGQSNAQFAQAEAEYRAAHQAFIVRVAERYFEVLAAQDNLEFARANRAAAERQLEQMRTRHSAGVSALTDLREVEANYDLTLAQEIDAGARQSSAEEALREVAGDFTTNLRQLKTELPLLLPNPSDIEAWRRRAESDNQKLVAALGAATVAEKEVSRQQAGHYPSLDLVATKSDTESGGRFGDSRIKDNIVALQLNVPIFSSGQVMARVREAQERYNEARERAEQQRRAAVRQVSDAYRAVTAGISRINALNRSLSSTDTALKAIQSGFRAGTRTAVDVIAAERTQLRTKRDYAAERYSYVLNTLRLKEAAGNLSQEDVSLLAAWFE
jgi:outer membrane protein